MSQEPQTRRNQPEPLRVELQRGSAYVLVRLVGSATMDCIENLRTQLSSVLAENPPELILDLSQLQFLNSSGLGALVDTHLQYRRQTGTLKLLNPSPPISHLLKLTNLDRLLPVYDSLEAALR